LAKTKAPHPNPLPEGEGTDRGVWGRYADVKVRVELRIGKAHKSAPSPRGEGWAGGVPMRSEFTATPKPNAGAPFKKKPRKIAAKREE
jgi:hypothetical protein